MSVQDLLGDFQRLAATALQLETIGECVFQSVSLWTPSLSRATYGGQLVAHCAEAAYRTVDAAKMHINNLHLKFLSAGKSSSGVPIVYSVKLLYDGRSFCSRLVMAAQNERNIFAAIVSFHRQERGDLEHQVCQPWCLGKCVSAEDSRPSLSRYVRSLESSTKKREPVHTEVGVAHVSYMNLMNLNTIQSRVPWDVWLRVESDGWAQLQKATGIPENRLHIIVACWLSDFIVAFSSLFPHNFPKVDIRQFSSLDHTIHFHYPDRIRVDEWFLYEVSSPWAANNRGLGQGRIYGQDGTLWMSTSQETLMRTGKKDLKSFL